MATEDIKWKNCIQAAKESLKARDLIHGLNALTLALGLAATRRDRITTVQVGVSSLLRIGEGPTALKWLNDTVLLDSEDIHNHPDVQQLHALALRFSGDLDSSNAVLQGLVDSQVSSIRRTAIYEMLALNAIEVHKYRDAREYFENAIGCSRYPIPVNVVAYCKVLIALDDKDIARNVLEYVIGRCTEEKLLSSCRRLLDDL